MLLGITVGGLAGESLLSAVVGGGVIGGLCSMPLMLVYMIYLFGKRHGTTPV